MKNGGSETNRTKKMVAKDFQGYWIELPRCCFELLCDVLVIYIYIYIFFFFFPSFWYFRKGLGHEPILLEKWDEIQFRRMSKVISWNFLWMDDNHLCYFYAFNSRSDFSHEKIFKTSESEITQQHEMCHGMYTHPWRHHFSKKVGLRTTIFTGKSESVYHHPKGSPSFLKMGAGRLPRCM